MRIYKCKLINLCDGLGNLAKDFPQPHGIRVRVLMYEDHQYLGGLKNQTLITSLVRMIDFERGLILTQNSIYSFNPFIGG